MAKDFDAYDPDAYDSWRDDRPVVPIDPASFEAEQDFIDLIRRRVEAEYARINGGTVKAYPIAPEAADCLCRTCMGSGLSSAFNESFATNVWSPCPDCDGWGVEGPHVLPDDDI